MPCMILHVFLLKSKACLQHGNGNILYIDPTGSNYIFWRSRWLNPQSHPHQQPPSPKDGHCRGAVLPTAKGTKWQRAQSGVLPQATATSSGEPDMRPRPSLQVQTYIKWIIAPRTCEAKAVSIFGISLTSLFKHLSSSSLLRGDQRKPPLTAPWRKCIFLLPQFVRNTNLPTQIRSIQLCYKML